MIADRIIHAINHLVPVIEQWDLAASGHLAAAMYALTCHDVTTTLDLTTAVPVPPEDAAMLERDLAAALHALAASPAAPPTRGSTIEIVHTDRSVAGTILEKDRRWLGVQVTTYDPTVQPIIPARSSATRDSARIPTLDQGSIARQSYARWRHHPDDLLSGIDLGLVTHRAGAHHLLAIQPLTSSQLDRIAALTATLPDATSLPLGLDPRTTQRAFLGLRELAAVATELYPPTARRSRR